MTGARRLRFGAWGHGCDAADREFPVTTRTGGIQRGLAGNDGPALDAAIAAAHASARQVADFLSGANSYRERDEVCNMLEGHGYTTLVHATAVIQGRFADGSAGYGKAGSPSAGLIAAFRDRFRSQADDTGACGGAGRARSGRPGAPLHARSHNSGFARPSPEPRITWQGRFMIPDVDNDSIVYLNGDYVRLGDARISVLDRGFIFGDGIYEVVPAYGGQPFRMAEHLARLQRSLARTRIATGRPDSDWAHLFTDMIRRSGLETCMVYLQVTRGVARRAHGFPEPAPEPTVFAMVAPLARPAPEQRTRGLAAVSMEDMRWLHCDIKSVSLLGNVFAKQYATDHGVDEVVQFRDGRLTEGSSCNIWVVKDGTLLAPLRDNHILEGIRYAFIEELARENAIPFESRVILREEVEAADELMLSSATKEVLPITRRDGQPVGDGQPGPVYARLRAAYDAAIDALMR